MNFAKGLKLQEIEDYLDQQGIPNHLSTLQRVKLLVSLRSGRPEGSEQKVMVIHEGWGLKDDTRNDVV